MQTTRSNWSIPHVFRACADPRNLPFSNEAGEGFENKIAELFARKLGKSVAYTFYPGATGFIRNTLNAHRCDVVMGIAQGDDIVQPTNPYYRTGYAAVYRTRGDRLKVSIRSSDSSPEDREDRRHRGNAARELSRNEWIARPHQVLRARRRHALRFPAARR